MSSLGEKWDRRFMEVAEMVASWSKDPSTKVGCIIVNERRQIVAQGFNGFPRGVGDYDKRYSDRALKYLMVQHAEANALHNAVQSPRDCIAYVTHMPCSQCAGALIQCGIKGVVTHEPDGGFRERFADSINATVTMFGETGVTLTWLER